MRLKYRTAFTLVELMVVIVIIGILAGIVVANYTRQTEGAEEIRVKADFKTIGSVAETYKLNTGAYPETLNDLIEPPTDITGWRGPYFPNGELPRDPWGKTYKYERCEGNSMRSYILTSFGPNRNDDGGGEDDLTNLNLSDE